MANVWAKTEPLQLVSLGFFPSLIFFPPSLFGDYNKSLKKSNIMDQNNNLNKKQSDYSSYRKVKRRSRHRNGNNFTGRLHCSNYSQTRTGSLSSSISRQGDKGHDWFKKSSFFFFFFPQEKDKGIRIVRRLLVQSSFY